MSLKVFELINFELLLMWEVVQSFEENCIQWWTVRSITYL